jgi:uncharacterized protein YlxP (DUF503 family)
VIVASQSWELSIPGCASLKEKRSVIRSLKDRLRNRFNLSVSETDYQDIHTRAELSAALVTNDRRYADEVLDKADTLVAENGRAVIVRTRRDFH